MPDLSFDCLLDFFRGAHRTRTVTRAHRRTPTATDDATRCSIRPDGLALTVALLLGSGAGPAQASPETARQAMVAVRDGDWSAARAACQAEADAGDLPCTDAMARWLLASRNPDRDPVKGIAALRRAAEGGLPAAQTQLGLEHYLGVNAEPRADAVLRWWTQAAGAGFASARVHLAGLYRDGRLVPRDSRKARELLTGVDLELAREALAEMQFYGEGGPREPELALAAMAELALSTNVATAKRVQTQLDKARALTDAARWDVGIYLNPWSPQVRRTLEGPLALRVAPGNQPLPVCWPDSSWRKHQSGVTPLQAGYDMRLTQHIQRQLNESGTWSGNVAISHEAACVRSAPLLVVTREINEALADSIRLTVGGEAKETTVVARGELIALVLATQQEARDRQAQAFQDRYADAGARFALSEALAAGRPQHAVLLMGGGGTSMAVCTLRGMGAQAQALAALPEPWTTRRLGFARSAPQEFDSGETLFEALGGKQPACGAVVADAATVQKLDAALTRDKIAHRLLTDASWTPGGLADAGARARGFRDAAQQALAEQLKAGTGDLPRLGELGLNALADWKALAARAQAQGYPAELNSLAAVAAFVDDEAAGRKVKKTAAQIARERQAAEDAAARRQAAADEAARKKQAAADEAARRKTEQAAAEQKKVDERDSNAERLSDIAGVAGAMTCHRAADEHVRSVARFDHKWDDLGFGSLQFDKYLVKVFKPGVLVMTSGHLSMQNGFGAFKRVPVRCHYDTRTKKVLEIELDMER